MQILQEEDTGNMGIKEKETFLRNLIFLGIFFFTVGVGFIRPENNGLDKSSPYNFVR